MANRSIFALRADSALAFGAGINLYGASDNSYPNEIRMFTTNDTNTPNLVIDSNGNVGIGTSSPATKLHVVDTTASIHVRSTNDPSWAGVRLQTPNSNYLLVSGFGSTAGFGIRDQNRNYAPLMIDSSGHVGIGTVTPEAKLHIQGQDNTGTSTGVVIRSTATSRASRIQFDKASDGETIIGSNHNLGTIIARGYDGTDYQSAASIIFSADGAPAAGDLPGRIEFSTTPNASATPIERMRITNAGNVGIGQNNPSFKLSIAGPTPSDANGAHIQIVEGTGSSSMHIGRALNYGFIQTQNSHPLILNPISNFVGIGTQNPTSLLEVAGDIKIPAANDYSYTSTQTRYLSLPASAFTYAGLNSGVYNYGDGLPYYRALNGGTGTVTASLFTNVQLPDSAVVTNLEFFVVDQDANYEVVGYLAYIQQGTTTMTNMAITNGSGAAASSAALATLSDNTIAQPTIDNQNRAYSLRLETKENNINLRVYGARITYTVTKTD